MKATLTRAVGRLRALGNMHRHDGGPLDRAAATVRRPLDRAYLRRIGRLGDLARLASTAPAPPAGSGARRVLILSLRAWPNHGAYEVVLGHALRLRGAEVALLTCGGGQPVCEVGWARRAFPRPCDRCGHFTDRLAEASGLRAFRLADELPWGRSGRAAPRSHEDIPGTSLDHGHLSAISAAWSAKSDAVGELPDGPQLLADYRVSSAAVERAVGNVIERFRPDVVVMVNGLFAAERTVHALAQRAGIRVVTYELCPREHALRFAQDEPAPRIDLGPIWSALRDRPLTPRQRAAITALLRDREQGVGMHERYFATVEDEAGRVSAELGLAPGKRVITLFTNLTWETSLAGIDIGFDSMLSWVEHAVRLAGELDDAELVVRVHPAERLWNSRQSMATLIRERLGEPPPNVHVIPPDEPLSSYTLVAMSDLVLTYATTVGLEAATRGVPVAVAADAHYRGRGFTIDLAGPADLRAAMAAPQAMSEEETELALRYAFTYFFRTMIPFDPVKAAGGRPQEIVTSAERLAPGRDPYLDLICEGILDGRSFVVPDELALGPNDRLGATA